MTAEQGPLGRSFDASALQATQARRDQLAHQAVLALFQVLRNARVHRADNAVFEVPLRQLQGCLVELIAADGRFNLRCTAQGIYVNGQAIRFDATQFAVASFVGEQLARRGVHGVAAAEPPGAEELRRLVHIFTSTSVELLGARGEAEHPLTVLSFVLDATGEEDYARSADTRITDAYAHAVFYVSKYIEKLRAGGRGAPVWAASRVVQDLVDLQRETPLRFLQLARAKAGGEAYWGYHAANVAVLAISFCARLGFAKPRRHDAGMAALFHDVGMAALPAPLLQKEDFLTDREAATVRASPLFAARAILRERDVHPAALERARSAYECHLDLAPHGGEPGARDGRREDRRREIGALGRILAICEAFDALTTTRPYRKPHSAQEALILMNSALAHHLDAGLLRQFAALVASLH